jgi:hypothetical protein
MGAVLERHLNTSVLHVLPTTTCFEHADIGSSIPTRANNRDSFQETQSLQGPAIAKGASAMKLG